MSGVEAKKPEYDLQRFVEAQAPVYDQVSAELRSGHKRTHWIWFVFPQIAGLGKSPTAQHFAIASLEEARAYVGHPVLGPRLMQCTQWVNETEGRSIEQILGHPDNLKFRSCMTLFAHATDDNAVFLQALSKYFSGEFDPLTLERLGRPSQA